MAARASIIPFRPRPRKRKKLVSDAVLGMLLFVFVEIMLFAGFISAFVIIKARAIGSVWPPPNQPRLPFEETAVNTTALIASGVVLLIAHRMFLKGNESVRRLLVAATLLGGMFVGLQGVEWLALIREGLTITSSTYGALFYTVIGAHATHAVAAILALAWATLRLARGTLTRDVLSAVAIFWYFVVLVWPFLYFVVYL
ncbi:MAG: heme-copper oxidase subunit III [Gemmatimonadetes bacterium]|nr:heme-copper oxidase subunit III [Gemmatimonadota bacterium]